MAMVATVASSGAMAAQPEKPVSIVLVHGAFVDASGWQAVYNILAKDGYEVLVVQNPTLTLEGDVEATERAITAAKHPVVLVGHSYGGMIITEAGVDPKVKSLAYIAAFAPDMGESVASLAEAPLAPGEVGPPLLPPKDGYVIVDPAKFPKAFAADSPASLTDFLAAAQVPWGVEAIQAKITKVAWKSKPSYFLMTTADHMIPPSAQKTMAKRSGAKTSAVNSSHAVMLSHPKEVAHFIEAAGE